MVTTCCAYINVELRESYKQILRIKIMNRNVVYIEYMDETILNPMDFYPRFPHITKQIFQQLDNMSLVTCREISKQWKTSIDDYNLLWLRIINVPSILQNGDTYLHLAAKTGQQEIFEFLLETEETKNPKNHLGETPFHTCCRYGHVNLLDIFSKILIELNIDFCCQDENGIRFGKKIFFGSTPFHLATYYGHSKVASLLIHKSSELKIDLNTKIASGSTAFHLACKNGHLKTVEVLIQKSIEFDIDLNSKDDYSWTGFHWAYNGSFIDIAEMLIQKSKEFKIDLNSKDENGWTALHWVCNDGYLEIAEMLILKSTEFNIDLNSKDFNGWTAFDWVCYYGNLIILEMFIQKSSEHIIDMNFKDKNGVDLKWTDILNKFKDKGINFNTEMKSILSRVYHLIKNLKGSVPLLSFQMTQVDMKDFQSERNLNQSYCLKKLY